MKTYLRLISYARPFGRFITPFFIFSLLGVVFGIFQFALLIPLLEVLFGQIDPQKAAGLLQKPEFSPSIGYLRDLFYHYFYRLSQTEGKMSALYFVTGVIVAAVILTNVFRYLAQRVVQDARTQLVARLRQALFAKINRLQVGYFTNERKGDLLARLTTDVGEVEGSVVNTLDAVFKEPFLLIGYFVFLFIISVKLTLFTLIIIPVSGLIIAWITKSLKQEAREGQESAGRLMSIIEETLSGVRIIRSFNGRDYVQKKFDSENEHYRATVRRIGNKRELAPAFSEASGVMVVAGILLYGGNLILGTDESGLQASEFITYIATFSQVLRPAKAIVGALSGIQRAQAAGERILAVIDVPETVQDTPNAVPLDGFREGITFDDVSFAYGDKPVLKEVSFHIPKGKTVALVGGSGGGKSTIADLIPRFYDVTGGRILLDGRDIRDYTLESLRQQMGIVTQESILFNDTIFNNIAFGQPNAREEDVVRAAKIANAHDFITATEHGYQTMIGDRGGKLSGGQRQRLSIARAVFKNPPVLILDEATSALDTESERLVQDALGKLMQGRTALVIAHRLSTIQEADEILVVQEGRIVERGHHQDLLERETSVYRRLTMLQQTS
ncbi:MAG: ABC transporter ATP-binding protein/permease [Cytophagales bacterium]|jgi:subfamily B ATP-binding cassette protein MsbA|nr:ABC transporter ATP-binding protein/permease [Cytophagales bacterium]